MLTRLHLRGESSQSLSYQINLSLQTAYPISPSISFRVLGALNKTGPRFTAALTAQFLDDYEAAMRHLHKVWARGNAYALEKSI